MCILHAATVLINIYESNYRLINYRLIKKIIRNTEIQIYNVLEIKENGTIYRYFIHVFVIFYF